jgi:hypothetical protein
MERKEEQGLPSMKRVQQDGMHDEERGTVNIGDAAYLRGGTERRYCNAISRV